MIYSNSVTIWFPDKESITIKWHYEFKSQEQLRKCRERLKKLYEGEVFFTLTENPKK